MKDSIMMLTCSFYTTAMDRMRQVQKTLPQNLRDNRGAIAQFVLLDYNSKDNLEQWVTQTLRHELKSGRLLYARERTKTRFHMSHAKNMAARLCDGAVLCSIDADTFTGPTLALILHSKFRDNPEQIIRYGYTGKIACTKDNFMKLGGYDETFEGWGNEDGDLFDRGRRMGLTGHLERVEELTQSIHHSNRLRNANFDQNIWVTAEQNGLKRKQHAKDGVTSVNPNGFGKGTVYLGLRNERLELT